MRRCKCRFILVPVVNLVSQVRSIDVAFDQCSAPQASVPHSWIFGKRFQNFLEILIVLYTHIEMVFPVYIQLGIFDGFNFFLCVQMVFSGPFLVLYSYHNVSERCIFRHPIFGWGMIAACARCSLISGTSVLTPNKIIFDSIVGFLEVFHAYFRRYEKEAFKITATSRTIRFRTKCDYSAM